MSIFTKIEEKSFVVKNKSAGKNENPSDFKKSVSFLTLGCRLNQSETDVLIKIFKSNGYEVVHPSKPSHICIVNTCTVTSNGDAKSRHAIRSMNRRNPNATIAVIGCYAQLAHEEISKLKGVKLIVGNERKMEILHFLEKIESERLPLIVNNKLNKNSFFSPTIPKILNSDLKSTKKIKQTKNLKFGQILNKSKILNRTRSLLKIQDGCDFMCSFCVIPFARGRSRYRDFSSIENEARMLVKDGAREIVITGVNIGTYKTGNLNFVNVIDSLNSIKGLDRIRISSIEPTTVPEILFDYMKDNQHKLVPFLHLPLQSGSNNILKKMNRRYTTEEYSDEILRSFESVPGICLGTDILVGFPEEHEIEFEKTLNFLQKLPLTYFHVFPFSERKRTAAYKIKNRIKSYIKQRRSKILRDLSSKKRIDFYKEFLGKTRNVLFESHRKNLLYKGYTDNFIKVELFEKNKSDFRNKIIPIKLCKIKGDSVLGEVNQY